MHGASSFPGYYFARDLVPGAMTIPWSSLNSEIAGGSETEYNLPLQQPSINHYIGYGKEVIRQAILNHEATFRYQVHELHRLYRRQKELMNELKRRYRQLETSQLGHITCPVQPDVSQKTFHVAGSPVINATGLDLSLFGVEKFQGPLVAAKSQQADANPYPVKIGIKEVKLSSTKFTKRMLDLELPGDQYIDCEEENTVEENLAEVPMIQCDPPKGSSEFQTESDLKLCSLHAAGSPSLYSTYGRTNFLIDLNEPVQLDESEIQISSSHVQFATARCSKIESDTFLVKKSACNSSFGSISSYLTFICDSNPNSEQDSHAKCFKNTDHVRSFENAESNFLPPRYSSEIGTAQRDTNAYGEYETENSVNALGRPRKLSSDGEAPDFHTKSCDYDDPSPAFTLVSAKLNPLHVKDMDNGQKEVKIENAQDPVSMLVKQSKDDQAVNSGTGTDFSSINSRIDLTSCINEDGPSSELCQSRPHIMIGNARVIDLEAPVSPENKECSPPRGESEDMQLEIPLPLVKEDEHPIGELDKVAVETMISMSSSGVHWCLEHVTNKPPEPFSNRLKWFAGVVSSMAVNLENEVEKILTSAANGDCNEFISDDNGCLKACKLKQTLKKPEDLCYKSNEHKEEEKADDLLPRQQGRRRRLKQRRVVRKKAMRTLGVPSRATGVGTNNITSRKRKMGENGFTKQRAHFNIAHCSVLERFMHSASTWKAKDKHVYRCLRGWGLPKGQRKTRRARSSFHGFHLLYLRTFGDLL